MKIVEILKLPVNRSVSGVFAVKTCKKKWEDTDGWVHQVVLSDSTGDILADVHIVENRPIQRGTQLILLEAMTQQGVGGLRLYIEKFKQETTTEPLEGSYLASFQSLQREVKSKVKCRYGEAYLVKYGKEGLLDFLESDLMKEIIDEVLK